MTHEGTETIGAPIADEIRHSPACAIYRRTPVKCSCAVRFLTPEQQARAV